MICSICKQEKLHYAKNLCVTCYQNKHIRKLIICSICGEKKQNHAKGLCESCYEKISRGSITNEGVFTPNKSCATYLGIDVAEQVLSKVFKDVKRMPPNNKGFDFICNKGKKIDVKSAVLRFQKRRISYNGGWNFAINKNEIADFFLCIAYDNRKDLNVKHLWLIPSEKINHLTGTSISKGTINKWKKYSLPINKVISCCNEMKIKK